MCKHLLKIQRLILALLIFGGGIFYTSSAPARVCFLPDSTDCGEGDVDVPEVQITCATYGGYETEAACLEARTNKTAQTCTLNSGCYYPKCAYDSERKCKNENPDKKCLSQDVDGVKCWYAQAKTCSDLGYKTSCGSDETATKVDVEASNAPCYTCAKKKTCKMMNYYGSKDNCPNPTSNYERKETNYTDKDGDKCYTCEPKACTKLNSSYKNKYNKDTCGSGKKSQKVEGTDSAADGPCYTCEDKPIDKCVDIEATPFLDIIEPTVKTTAATKTETQTDATFRCGSGPTVETTNNNVVIDYNGRLTATTGNYITYSYDGATKKYYVIYKNSRVNNGQPLCLKNQLCSDYVSPYTTSPVYRDAYYIERAQGSYTSYASQTYCCLSGLSGRSVNELSSCKRAKTNTIQTDTAYRVNAYVCSVGETLSGTKCKKTTYTCPEGYTLDANNVCKQLTCNEGYTLQDVNGEKRCVADAYSCPTDGKYKYKLSGNKCVCDTSKTCSIISNGTWKGEKDKNTCPAGYKPEVVEGTIGATVFSDGPCYKCEKIEDKTITIYLTNTEIKDQSSSTLICNGKIERVNSTTKEYVEFSHDSNHTVKLRLNGPNKPCTELYADPIVLEEDNSYDLYAEFPSGDGSISGYYYDNVPTSFEVVVDGVVVASDEIRRGKIDNTNWTHLRVLSSLNGKVIQPSKSNPYTIKFVYENEKNNTCYRESSSGEVENNSTIYYFPDDGPYYGGECAYEMTINVACNRVIDSSGFDNISHHEYRKLYINGKASMSPDGYSKPDNYESVEAHWYGYGNWMECTGCATVTCKFKYGDKKTITIINVGGEEERKF